MYSGKWFTKRTIFDQEKKGKWKKENLTSCLQEHYYAWVTVTLEKHMTFQRPFQNNNKEHFLENYSKYWKNNYDT